MDKTFKLKNIDNSDKIMELAKELCDLKLRLINEIKRFEFELKKV
jgi:hypothetical protein